MHTSAPPSAPAIVNPLLPSGPDPWVIVKDGVYYYMNTTGSNLTIWKAPPTPARTSRIESGYSRTPRPIRSKASGS